MQKSKNVQNRRDLLLTLRKQIPFLKQIKDEDFFILDTTEFFIPYGDISEARLKLESILGHFVMTYKSHIFIDTIPLNNHLCSNIKSARLTKRQRNILDSYEKKFNKYGVSFVAYQKPVTLIDPKESPLYDYYKVKGLLPK